MTIRYTSDVFCDACANWIHGAVSDKPTGLAKPALRKAQKAGWSRDTKSQYLDLCPKCLAEYRQNPIESKANND